ncbi:hypothetical protein IFM89_000230 [Coptis chinensis]|uniref:Uncharacterized protein n=1 Tax=Coptis chinensis TaxID=261450 RepID=A0A835I969_9MAGN|nr:hypothetical protein IFM89_000230 [Coptis chinensis]
MYVFQVSTFRGWGWIRTKKKRILTLRPVTRTVLYVALHTNDNGTCPIEEHCVEVDLIEFSKKDTGLQSKECYHRMNHDYQAYWVVGLPIYFLQILKDFFDVKPALLGALDLEYEKNPFEIRLESIIDSVNKILEEANKAFNGTVELFGDLRGRLYDTNKNLVMATLVVVGGVASAMGPMVEKSSKHLKEEMKLSYLAQELISTDRLAPQSWY